MASMVRPGPMPPRWVPVFSDKPRARKPLRRVAKNKEREHQIYLEIRHQFLLDYQRCQFDGCLCNACDVHHKRKRGRYLLDASTFMAVCRFHHTWLHDNPKRAKELGYLV